MRKKRTAAKTPFEGSAGQGASLADTRQFFAQKPERIACLSLFGRREGLRGSQYVSENGLGVIRYLADAKRPRYGFTQVGKCIEPVSLGASCHLEKTDNSSSRIIFRGIHSISFSKQASCWTVSSTRSSTPTQLFKEDCDPNGRFIGRGPFDSVALMCGDKKVIAW